MSSNLDKSQGNLSFVLHKAKDIRFEQTPFPTDVQPDEVLIETVCVGICGSDVHYWQHGAIGHFVLDKPMILGHETCGIVRELGNQVSNLNLGDLVAIEPGIGCSKCNFCMSGKYHLCEKMIFHATPPHDGTLRKFFKHPAHLCFKLPDNLSPEEGALIEPLSVAVHSCDRAQIEFGSDLLICGAGPIGSCVLLVAKAYNLKNICIADVNKERLEFAKKLGANHTYHLSSGENPDLASENIQKLIGKSFERVIDCAGAESSIHLGLKATRNGGVFTLVANCAPLIKVPLICAATKEIDIRGVFRYVNCYPKSIYLVSSRLINVKQLITDKFSFENSLEAFELAKTGKAIKVIIQVKEP